MATAGPSGAALVLAIVVAALPLRSAASLGSARDALSDRRRAQEPNLEQVLVRAAKYVTTLHKQLSSIVAEETYVQTARAVRFGSMAESKKTLRSDLLLVRPPDADRYVEFRDVFEVDGRAVRDRDERLVKLFLEPDTNVDQLRAIIDESARYNIGDIPRNINTPMLTLHFLQPSIQDHFRFRRAESGDTRLGNIAAVPGRSAAMFRVKTEMWVIEFRETEQPTIIKTARSRDFPAEGRFWIDPETGAVLMSELVMENSDVKATINVSYQSEPILGFHVPVEMRERYHSGNRWIDGIATYGRFRQFQVHTDTVLFRRPGGLQ